ncbi:MAG: SPOR domain-containing protein [Paracoccus sp. (in: a-proteobacteria)]|uniref:SPOR domain-containing protein n=1 Tax=Paracoccus sp. TaxID=267 RepID=UPI0026DED1CD|nr:SPOR domain-containing protein [Paracoccus sp. (in: a-proteobacteria)]MDO5630393.1 SPOR domain-containing protein [Paracoccus sp. (in: a-proteobacteria)]
MAVMDFREGGFGFTFSRQRGRRDYDFEERGWDDLADDSGHSAQAQPEGLSVRLARLTHYLGAVISVGLMIGLVYWGWQLVMRDVSGVPVITALSGDARTAPADPGGELTSYTGLAVNGVAAGGRSEPAAQVAIAPSATGLTDSDVAMGQLGATAREPAAGSDPAISFDTDPMIAQSDADMRAELAAAEALAADQAVAQAQIMDAPASEGPVNAAVLDENGQQAQAMAITDALAQAQAQGGLTASVRPAPRPRRAAAVASAAATPAQAPAAATVGAGSADAPAARPAAVQQASAEPAPAPRAATAPSGAPLAQIGAFDSNAIANSEWARLSGKFGSQFSGKAPVIQEHRANGRTFWRLRVAGFDSRDDARRFCEALKSGGTDCIPATAQ